MTKRQTQDRRLFKRLLHAHSSLHHARSCATQILSRNLHASRRGSADRSLLECVNTALIVSYASPFSANKGSADVAKDLPSNYLNVLDAPERAFHHRMLEARDRDHAHSDPQALSVRVSVELFMGERMVTPVGRDPFAPLERDDVERLHRMIEKLMGKIQSEQQRLWETFSPGETF